MNSSRRARRAPWQAGLTKATVTASRLSLEARKLGPISISVRITAVRKPAVEAAGNTLLAPELVSGIARIKSIKLHGVRVGNWLSLRRTGSIGPAGRPYSEGSLRPCSQ